MSMFDHAYYCGMETDREAYDAREEMIEETTPAPTPEGYEALVREFKREATPRSEGYEWNAFRAAIWASGLPVD